MLNSLSVPGHRTKKAIDNDTRDVEFHPKSTVTPNQRLVALYSIIPCKCAVNAGEARVCAKLALCPFNGSDFTPLDE
jgi:hypothetical protein